MKQLLSVQEGKKIVGTSAYLADVAKLEHQKCSMPHRGTQESDSFHVAAVVVRLDQNGMQVLKNVFV